MKKQKADAEGRNHCGDAWSAADGCTRPARATDSVSARSLTEGHIANYLEDRGLREGSHGEIVNERGRTVFEVGFTRAIRKVLDDWPSQ